MSGNSLVFPAKIFGLIPGRVTYVADRSGKVVYIFDSQTETQRHADEALKIMHCFLKRTDWKPVMTLINSLLLADYTT